MIAPNRLTNPGETRARERVEALFERIDALGVELFLLPVPRLDLEARDADLAELEAVADRFGRGGLLDEARQRVRDALLVRTATRTEVVAGRVQLVSSGTVEDHVARGMAIQDAVAVAIVDDVLDAETAARLSTPGRWMLRLPLDEGDDADGDPALPPPIEPDDDAGTEGEDENEDDGALGRTDLRQRRVVLFVVLAAIALPAAFATGVSIPVLALVVPGLALIAWLFADP